MPMSRGKYPGIGRSPPPRTIRLIPRPRPPPDPDLSEACDRSSPGGAGPRTRHWNQTAVGFAFWFRTAACWGGAGIFLPGGRMRGTLAWWLAILALVPICDGEAASDFPQPPSPEGGGRVERKVLVGGPPPCTTPPTTRIILCGVGPRACCGMISQTHYKRVCMLQWDKI